MTLAVATGVVFLPFSLNVCAIGDRVESLTAHVEEADITITFPASMTEGTVGKSIYPDGWAWWVADRIYVESSALLEEIDADVTDTARMRDVLLAAAQQAVRRLLNSYRWRLHQPQAHPVTLDPAQFTLELVHADGTRDALPEPVESFFFNRTPATPPFDTSINDTTLKRLQQDVLEGIEPPHAELIDLDIEWLQSIGETTRAQEMAELCRMPQE